MATYKTPGVYVEEISTFPPSVAEVATAIPAFIGYTEKGPSATDGPQVARISTLLEYENLFGRAAPSTFTITAQQDPTTALKSVAGVERDPAADKFLLYYSLDLYFKNGGGRCYIVSVGNYTDTPDKQHFLDGLDRLKQEDEPTLILFPDAVKLPSADDYYELGQQALAQCNELGDRFAVLDVLHDAGVAAFRGGIGTDALLYGAAYHPYLQTSLNYQYKETAVSIVGIDAPAQQQAPWQGTFGENGIIVSYTQAGGDAPKVQIVLSGESADATFEINDRELTIRSVQNKTGADVVVAWQADTQDHGNFMIEQNGLGSEVPRSTGSSSEALTAQALPSSGATLDAIKSTETGLYNQVKTALNQQRVVLPPSPAVAGIYARVDRDRGVWKAPANVSVSSVIGPVSKISHQDQEDLNVDPTAGKSINAIREFTGKGTLVWGARTLAGNDNEWRYIPVRRLFNLIEESTQKATAFAVFESNDATTWLKVKAMIESYLYGLWEQGALAGPTPEAAYFVNVGLGKTMTAQDVLEGRMIVEIGVAAVRPAEFIILRFSHKMQEA